MKSVQYFSKEYLKDCEQMSIEDHIRFLEHDAQLLTEAQPSGAHTAPLKLIGIKMPEDLLSILKLRAKREGVPYQSLMKKLLRSALKTS